MSVMDQNIKNILLDTLATTLGTRIFAFAKGADIQILVVRYHLGEDFEYILRYGIVVDADQ